MAFRSELDGASNSYLAEGRGLEREKDPVDTRLCPSTAELSEAVSVSLGLGAASSPLGGGGMNLHGACVTGSYPYFANTSARGDEFGDAFHEAQQEQQQQQVSCGELLGAGAARGARSVTRGPVIARYVRTESNLFEPDQVEPRVTPQRAEQLAPLPPHYPAAAAGYGASLYQDCPAGWRVYGHSGQPQADSGGLDGPHLFCKNCGQALRGARQECHCLWYNKGDQGAKAGARAAMVQEFSQVESYPNEATVGAASYSAVKTEPSAWLGCTDRAFRHEDLFTGLYLSERRVCQVCGDDASGCHYGAVTCGSCKVFFKRAAAGKQNHLCASRNDCTIDKLRRKNCASCRLKRCFMSGMSLKGRRVKSVSQSRGGDELQPLPSSMVAWNDAEQVGRSAVQNAMLEASGGGAMAHSANQAVALYMPPTLHDTPSLLTVLQTIEPDLVNAGHDHALPDSPESLLTSLNELGERQLVVVVQWAKALPGFRELHVDDQMSLIQLSWMGVMVFALGWRSYKLTNSSLLYFAPDLVFNDKRMKLSTMYEHCLSMKLLSQRFCTLNVTQEEFLCMKALVLFSIMPMEGPKNRHHFDELRTSYMRELDRLAGHHGEATRTQRLFQLTQLLDYLQMVVRKLHQFTYDLFVRAQTLQTSVNFPEMITEIVSAHVPKILSGMVKPILFHNTH